MLRKNRASEDSYQIIPPAEQEVTWTETQMVVTEATLYPEKLDGGKTSFSIRLELEAVPESSSNTRNRMVLQLALGLEEKDVPTFARLLGRNVFFSQQQPVETLEREQLVLQLKESLDKNDSLQRKVTYLNNSLHHYVQESR